MAETVQHPKPQAADRIMEDDEQETPVNWTMVDRLIILMSLAVTRRFLRKTRRMPLLIRAEILERIDVLIERYKDPGANW